MSVHAPSPDVLAPAAPCYNFGLSQRLPKTVSQWLSLLELCVCWQKAQCSDLVSEGRKG